MQRLPNLLSTDEEKPFEWVSCVKADAGAEPFDAGVRSRWNSRWCCCLCWRWLRSCWTLRGPFSRRPRCSAPSGSACAAGSPSPSTQMAQGACLTDTVKSTVQSNAMGLLHGSSGLALIKVHYFQPPAVNSTSAATDVSTNSDGDQPGNIMQVSVQNYLPDPLAAANFQLENRGGHQSAGDTGCVLRRSDRAGVDHGTAVHRDGALGAWL